MTTISLDDTDAPILRIAHRLADDAARLRLEGCRTHNSAAILAGTRALVAALDLLHHDYDNTTYTGALAPTREPHN